MQAPGAQGRLSLTGEGITSAGAAWSLQGPHNKSLGSPGQTTPGLPQASLGEGNPGLSPALSWASALPAQVPMVASE